MRGRRLRDVEEFLYLVGQLLALRGRGDGASGSFPQCINTHNATQSGCWRGAHQIDTVRLPSFLLSRIVRINGKSRNPRIDWLPDAELAFWIRHNRHRPQRWALKRQFVGGIELTPPSRYPPRTCCYKSEIRARAAAVMLAAMAITRTTSSESSLDSVRVRRPVRPV